MPGSISLTSSNIELRLLRYAIAVAEELHFTRASRRLHVSTPSLSRQIRQLEETVGYALFDRRTREVVMTPAGAAFVAEARQALEYVHRAVEKGAAASRRVPILSVGYTPFLDTAVLLKIQDSYSSLGGAADLHFESACSIAQADRILSGDLQAGLLVLPVPFEKLHVHCLIKDRLMAAVPDNSALARTPVLAPARLDGEPTVWFGRATNPHVYEEFVLHCRRVGFMPKIVHEVLTVTEILDCVAAGFGIGFVAEAVSTRLSQTGVRFRELSFPLLVSTGVAFRRGNQPDQLQLFLRALRRVFNCGDIDP